MRRLLAYGGGYGGDGMALRMCWTEAGFLTEHNSSDGVHRQSYPGDMSGTVVTMSGGDRRQLPIKSYLKTSSSFLNGRDSERTPTLAFETQNRVKGKSRAPIQWS